MTQGTKVNFQKQSTWDSSWKVDLFIQPTNSPLCRAGLVIHSFWQMSKYFRNISKSESLLNFKHCSGSKYSSVNKIDKNLRRKIWWWRSRMWGSPTPTNILKTPLYVQLFTQNLLNADKSPQDSNRARKYSWNWVGQKKKKGERKKKWSRSGSASLGGSWKDEKLLPLGSPPASEKKSQERVGTLSTGGEHRNRCKTVKMETALYKWQ